MPKRTATSSSSTPKAKRVKADINLSQLQLDKFFVSPSKQRSDGPTSSRTNVPSPELIDVDALDDLEDSTHGIPETSSGVAVPSAVAIQDGVSPPSDRGIEADSVRTPRPPIVFGAKAIAAEKLLFTALDVDPVLYEPESQAWATTGAPYSFLAHAFTALSQTRSRIIIINTLTNTLRTIATRHPSSLLPSLYLLSNSLSPAYVGVEMGIGSSIISKAIQQVSGLSAKALKQLYTATGDAGDVAFEAKSKVRTLVPHAPLTIQQVYDALLKISGTKGQGAAKTKERIVEKLLVAGTGEEVRYLVRTLSSNLRVGAVRTSILTALARAFVMQGPTSSEEPSASSMYASADLVKRINMLPSNQKKGAKQDPTREQLKVLFSDAEALVKQVFVRHPCYDDIVNALLDGGLSQLADKIPLTVGIPLHPTLGSPTRSLDEIYERLGDLAFSAEFKYDGQRAQIHAKKDGQGKVAVKIFSRHLEDMTSKYPDVILMVKEIMETTPSLQSFILDAEIVAVDHVTNELKSFQELSNRPRKDVKMVDVVVSVSVFVFDLLYFNEESYLAKPFRDRRMQLHSSFPPYTPKDHRVSRLSHVESCESEKGPTAIQDFWERAVESRCEGLMIKVLDYEPVEISDDSTKNGKTKRKALPATYEPDKRTSAWLKLKKDYVDGVGDSLDLVPIGAWYGNGRKAGWWSPVLLGLWNPETGVPVAVCKCMSGFSDAFYKSLLERYPIDSDSCSAQSRWECDSGGFRPDVYFRPNEVWEVKGADITESPVSVAARGLISEKRGLSLRFPRFIRARNDKSVEQASTPSFLASLWRKQQKAPAGPRAVDDGDLVDVESPESGVEEVSDENSEASDLE